MLWPGAGTGEGRDGLLRAHPPGYDGHFRIDFANSLTESARAFSVAWEGRGP
jgi:hypothetical protein